jgi:hypothetical protein
VKTCCIGEVPELCRPTFCGSRPFSRLPNVIIRVSACRSRRFGLRADFVLIKTSIERPWIDVYWRCAPAASFPDGVVGVGDAIFDELVRVAGSKRGKPIAQDA